MPELLVSWNYDFRLEDHTLVAHFAGGPGAPIVLDGQDIDRHGGTLGLGFAYLSNKGWTTSVRYDGHVRDDYLAHGLIGDFRFVF